MKYRVLTYNIHKGFDTFGVKFVLAQIKKAIADTNVDLCLLQEVVGENQDWKNKHPNRPSESQFEYLADTVWPYYSYGKNAIFSAKHHGNAILSKFPVVSEANYDLTLHRFEQRGFLHCKVQIPDTQKHIDIINTHLNLRENDRLKQINKIVSHLKTFDLSQMPLILGGDFNDWNLSVDQVLRNELNLFDSHFFLNQEFAKSFPSFWPKVCLDRLYFVNLIPLNVEVLKGPNWARLSDHLPVYSEYQII